MNQKQAGNVLRRSAPPGEHPAFINPMEANWLRGMGGAGKRTKSGLRSYATQTGTADQRDDNAKVNVFGQNVSGATQRAEHARVADLSQYAGREGGNGSGVSSPFPGNGIGLPNIPNPLAGGTETRIPAGPGSVTNPNDPYGIQKKIAGGASDLIDKEYEAPTLTPEERIATTSAETLRARTGVDAMQGTGQDAYGNAAGVGADVSGYKSNATGPQSFLQGNPISNYANPFTENVINRNTQSAMDAMEIRRNQLVAKEDFASPSGRNDRGAIERGVMQAQGLKNLSDQTAALYSQGFDKGGAMKKYDMDSATGADQFNVRAGQTDQDIRLRGAGTEIAGTDAGRSAAGTDIGLLAGVGADVEGREQNVKDASMEDFYDQRGWGESKLASAANIAGTNPTGSTTNTTGSPQYKKKDKFGNIIAGAASGWLASGGNPWGAAVGGLGGAFS